MPDKVEIVSEEDLRIIADDIAHDLPHKLDLPGVVHTAQEFHRLKKNGKKILDLIRELKQESKFLGMDKALYDYGATAAFHTSEKRREIINRAAIVEQITQEIKALLA